MGIITWIIVGLIAGALAKLVMPGDDPGGIIVTILIGVAGAFVGGLVVGLLGVTGVTGLSIWSIVVATLGAIVLPVPLRRTSVNERFARAQGPWRGAIRRRRPRRAPCATR